MLRYPIIPYPPIEKLGLIGDRRTAAQVAADGTLCWMCLPHYDGATVFGALLDAEKGGAWKFGLRARRFGRQRYASGGPILETVWDDSDCSLELLDFMPWPHTDRALADVARRVVLRRLRCTRGRAGCQISLRPRDDFAGASRVSSINENTALFSGRHQLGFWCSRPMPIGADSIEAEFDLRAGEEIWCAFGPQEHARPWTVGAASEALRSTLDYWNRWLGRIEFRGSRQAGILRSAMLVHLLSFAPTGALIASPTTSLPERIGGNRNYDYRLTWIRDASLGLGLLVRLGLTDDAKHFMHWLAGLESSSGSPLQVLYTVDGGPKAPVVERDDVEGYRQSQPVRFGNAAVSMVEIDSFGYLADCALAFLNHGGEWAPEYWTMIRRIADFTAGNWQCRGSSIWEVPQQHHFFASRVMSWVTLDRALQIAERTNRQGGFLETWTNARAKIFAEIMTQGWSERLGAFRQRDDADTLDAALLLIPIMKFLPVTHPRVTATVDRIVDYLEVNGFLHRFVASEQNGQGLRPIGEEEGGFLICTFWLAQVLAQRGEIDRAEAILRRAENIAGDLCLFAEGVDARNRTFLGNMPLVFSQVEYARAAIALSEARVHTASDPAAS